MKPDLGRHSASLFAAALAATTLAAHGADAPPSELQIAVWAASCMACHGTDGRASGAALAIAGQSEQELLEDLREFRSGARPSTVMHQHTRGYSDAELAALARYFARRTAR